MGKTTNIVSTPQDMTGSWADLGAEIHLDGFETLTVWAKITINDSTDVRFRGLCKQTKTADDEYEFVVQGIPQGSLVTLSPVYYEVTSDVDQNLVISVPLGGAIPVIQFQVKVGTVGATAGTIDRIDYSLG